MASETATPHGPLGIEDYVRLEEASTSRHEYVGGEVDGEGRVPTPCPELDLSLAEICEGIALV